MTTLFAISMHTDYEEQCDLTLFTTEQEARAFADKVANTDALRDVDTITLNEVTLGQTVRLWDGTDLYERSHTAPYLMLPNTTTEGN